jgi:hypothetical protein
MWPGHSDLSRRSRGVEAKKRAKRRSAVRDFNRISTEIDAFGRKMAWFQHSGHRRPEH